MRYTLVIPHAVDPNQPTSTAAPVAGIAKSEPGQAAGKIADNLHEEGKAAAGPWFGLALFVIGILMLLKRDKRLFLIGGLGVILLALVLVFKTDALLAFLSGIVDKALG